MNLLYSFIYKYLYIRNLYVYKGIGYELYIYVFLLIFYFFG